MKPSEVLRKALELMDGGKKWCKRAYRNGDSYCSVGAITNVAIGDRGHYPARRFLTTAIDNAGIATHWNDSAADFSVIESGFKKAIALAEEAGQ